MKINFLFSLLALGMFSIAYCGQESRIELNDGSVINAEIVSLQNSTYTLKTASLGEFHVEAGKIRRIEPQATTSLPPTQNLIPSNMDVNAEMAKMKTRMAADPEITSIITGLVSDPQFQEIASDPEIVNAANSGNIQALMSNQKFMSLINNQKIQQIRDKLAK